MPSARALYGNPAQTRSPAALDSRAQPVMADEAPMTDAERERAIRSLRERYARGALTNDELDERLDALFAARIREWEKLEANLAANRLALRISPL